MDICTRDGTAQIMWLEDIVGHLSSLKWNIRVHHVLSAHHSLPRHHSLYGCCFLTGTHRYLSADITLLPKRPMHLSPGAAREMMGHISLQSPLALLSRACADCARIDCVLVHCSVCAPLMYPGSDATASICVQRYPAWGYLHLTRGHMQQVWNVQLIWLHLSFVCTSWEFVCTATADECRSDGQSCEPLFLLSAHRARK